MYMAKICETELIRVKDEFFARGETIAEWARQHGFTSNAVYQVLSGRCQASRGDSHLIAVALGLKAKPSSQAAQAVQQENAM